MQKRLTDVARKLRTNLTEAEKVIWLGIRTKNFGVKFRRQAVIGEFVVDFVCFERKLVIEVDGGQHSENENDRLRDEWLQKEGFKVLRFWNNDVLTNKEGVLGKICEQLNPLPSPPHKGEGKLID